MIVPSLTILYEQDKIRKPWIRLVAVGNQWFWTYAITTAKINKFIFDCYIIKSSDLRLGMPRVLETDNNLKKWCLDSRRKTLQKCYFWNKSMFAKNHLLKEIQLVQFKKTK